MGYRKQRLQCTTEEKEAQDDGEKHPKATDGLQAYRSTSLDGSRSESSRRIFIRR